MLDGPTSELLAIILLPVLVGFFWLAVAVIFQGPNPEEEKSRRRSHNNCLWLSIADAFDPDHVIVWQSQTPALRLIGSEVSLSVLYDFFAHFSTRYPEFYEDTTFDDWLRFLQSCDLVARVGREVHLTANGRGFLDYLERAGKASSPKHTVH